MDGNALLHRAYHALPPLTTLEGEPINAVYGFISILCNLIAKFEPTHIIACFDTPKPTFRHAEYVGYQANRPRADSELASQFAKVFQALEALQIPVFSVEGYEADDVIGTLSHQITDSEVVIVTGDRDILQLVEDDKIKVYMPTKGLEGKLYGEKEVIERMDVKPNQIVDLKALIGDPSDNYKGVPGIGPKTAGNLLKEFETLENIYKNLGKIPEKNARKLAEGAESAGLCKKLATIVKDAPVTLNLTEAQKWDIKSDKVLKVFSEFGFKTLTKRVIALGQEIDKKRQLILI